MHMKPKIEICVDSLESAFIAEKSGADRLELCAELSVGGLTPSIGLINQVNKHIGIPVNIMIRPRSGDFCYTELEFDTMLENVKSIRNEYPNVSGFVTGILTSNGEIHFERMTQLIELAKPIPVTIHRAFDMTQDLLESLKVCKLLGIERVLTAGFANKAIDGMNNLVLLKEAAGDDIIIMPGSGVSSANVKELVSTVKPQEIHMSAKQKIISRMRTKRNDIQMGRTEGAEELIRYVTNGEEIATVDKMLQEVSL